jgi:hypothetical protein
LREEVGLGLPSFAIVGVFHGGEGTGLAGLLANMEIATAFDRGREQLPEGVFEKALLRAGGGDNQDEKPREEKT